MSKQCPGNYEMQSFVLLVERGCDNWFTIAIGRQLASAHAAEMLNICTVRVHACYA